MCEESHCCCCSTVRSVRLQARLLLYDGLAETHERRNRDAVVHAARHARQFPDVRGRRAEQYRHIASDRQTVATYVAFCQVYRLALFHCLIAQRCLRVRSTWQSKILEIYFMSAGKVLEFIPMLKNSLFWKLLLFLKENMFYFVVHLAYFSCVSCLQDFTFFNTNLTTRRVLIRCFENSTFGVMMSWSGHRKCTHGHLGDIVVLT